MSDNEQKVQEVAKPPVIGIGEVITVGGEDFKLVEIHLTEHLGTITFEPVL